MISMGLQQVKRMFHDLIDAVGLRSILVGVCSSFCVYYFFIRKKYKLPPGPFALPLIGNYEVYLSKRMHRNLYDLSKKYGPVISLKVGPMTWVVLNNFDSVMEALVTRKADFANRPHVLSLDLFSGGGKDIAAAQYTPTWQLHRKIANKGIRQYLKGEHLETMVTETMKIIMDGMETEKGPFYPKHYLDQITYIMLTRMCFGKRYGLNDPDVNYINDVNEGIMETIGNGLLEDLVPILKDVWPTERYKRLLGLNKEMFEFVRKQLDEHKETFDSSNIRDFTDSLLLAREEAERDDDATTVGRLSDSYLIYTLIDIFLAGVDTSRMTLTWFVLFMAGQPEIQKKCHEEIEAAIGKSRPPMVSDRENLQYTEACLYETMRLGSVAALGVPHATVCDSTVGGYDVPKGTTVLINHFALHRDPKYWDNVEEFRPERYLNSEGKIVGKPESWLPFSAGKRVCLGEPVAKAELSLLCANLLQRFVIKLPPGVKPNYEEAKIPNLFVTEKYEIIVEKK